jgi:hypothetical protein
VGGVPAAADFFFATFFLPEVLEPLDALKKLYLEKNEHLSQFFSPVTQPDFYRAVFPEGSFERKGHFEDNRPNGLALDIRGRGRAFHTVITDGLEEIRDLNSRNFAIMSPIGYFGVRRSSNNARFLYAFTFDLDGVKMQNLFDVIHQMENGILPKATYIVNSGTGLHLYYLFERPIPLYPDVQNRLKTMKYALTERIWNKYTSTYETPQRQGIMQGFRIIGSPSKLGKEFPVAAFNFDGDSRVTIEYLNDFVYPVSARILDIKYKSGMSLTEAKEKYPGWYDRRVVQGETRGRWVAKRELYDWWKRRIWTEIVVGHRFYGVFTLAIYAMKCGIGEDELRADAYEIMQHFDKLSTEQNNRFTEDDVISALEVYNESFVTFPRDDIAKLAGVLIQPNKRNGRKRWQHLRLARGQLAILKEMGEAKPGRPSARQRVDEYRQQHPEATKAEAIRETGLSKPTVYKWWNAGTGRE